MRREDFRRMHFDLTKIATKGIWLIIYALLAFSVFAFMGCSKPIYKIQTKEVFVPIKCNLELPKKPKENRSFESHKE